MEKQSGYYMENYMLPEMKRNFQAGAEVVGSLVSVFKPATDVAKDIIILEISRALRSIALKR